jgi:hypothetical protein
LPRAGIRRKARAVWALLVAEAEVAVEEAVAARMPLLPLAHLPQPGKLYRLTLLRLRPLEAAVVVVVDAEVVVVDVEAQQQRLLQQARLRRMARWTCRQPMKQPLRLPSAGSPIATAAV